MKPPPAIGAIEGSDTPDWATGRAPVNGAPAASKRRTYAPSPPDQAMVKPPLPSGAIAACGARNDGLAGLTAISAPPLSACAAPGANSSTASTEAAASFPAVQAA